MNARTPLAILHLDERVVVVDKPAGLLVHKTRTGSGEDALLQRLRDQLGRRVHPVSRLDRATSGLIAYAFDRSAARDLQAGLAAEDAVKEYLVLARGPCPAWFESRFPLRDDKDVERDAWSEFARLAAFPAARCALLRARIHTGRANQIRRHLALARHHVLGDTHFGKARANRRFARRHGLARLFLHAWCLEFAHPAGGRMTVTAPLPAELVDVLARLGAPEGAWAQSPSEENIQRNAARLSDTPATSPLSVSDSFVVASTTS
jgi:tRNA pseudouridine65 synthase